MEKIETPQIEIRGRNSGWITRKKIEKISRNRRCSCKFKIVVISGKGEKEMDWQAIQEKSSACGDILFLKHKDVNKTIY